MNVLQISFNIKLRFKIKKKSYISKHAAISMTGVTQMLVVFTLDILGKNEKGPFWSQRSQAAAVSFLPW